LNYFDSIDTRFNFLANLSKDPSPLNPSNTIAIFSSGLNKRLVGRFRSLIMASDFLGLPGPFFQLD